MATFFPSAGIRESSPFPDGQPHIALPFTPPTELVCRIASGDDLLRVAMAVEAIQHQGVEPTLRITYLMGGRMDRRLSDREPFTLKTICHLINSWGCRVTVFVPHSDKTYMHLTRSFHSDLWPTESFYDMAALHFANSWSDTLNETIRHNIRQNRPISFVFPDTGACERFSKLQCLGLWKNSNVITLHKERDERSGIVGPMHIIQGEPRDSCLIIDDLCDGGATFRGAAEVLRANGAKRVGLAVAHGIFSRGLPIPGIDFVACTDSFQSFEDKPQPDWLFKFH